MLSKSDSKSSLLCFSGISRQAGSEAPNYARLEEKHTEGLPVQDTVQLQRIIFRSDELR